MLEGNVFGGSIRLEACSPRLPGGWCCLEWTLLTLIERYDVCVGFVCWLRLDYVLGLFVLVLV
jgi:hypothetical protein